MIHSINPIHWGVQTLEELLRAFKELKCPPDFVASTLGVSKTTIQKANKLHNIQGRAGHDWGTG